MRGAEPSVIVYAFTAVVVAAIAIWSFIVDANLLRRVIAFNVLGAGVFLLMVAIARRTPGEAPDPVPHAMVLTGIVVAISASAFALVLVRRIYDVTGRMILPDNDDAADASGDEVDGESDAEPGNRPDHRHG